MKLESTQVPSRPLRVARLLFGKNAAQRFSLPVMIRLDNSNGPPTVFCKCLKLDEIKSAIESDRYYAPQHFLNFLPLPHEHGSFLPTDFDDAAGAAAACEWPWSWPQFSSWTCSSTGCTGIRKWRDYEVSFLAATRLMGRSGLPIPYVEAALMEGGTVD